MIFPSKIQATYRPDFQYKRFKGESWELVMCDRRPTGLDRTVKSTETSWHYDNKVTTAGITRPVYLFVVEGALLGDVGYGDMWLFLEVGDGGYVWVTVCIMCVCGLMGTRIRLA